MNLQSLDFPPAGKVATACRTRFSRLRFLPAPGASRLIAAVGCAVVLAAVCGCSSTTSEPKLSTVPVKGTLYVDGKPHGPVLMSLTANPPDSKSPVVNGYVKPDGSFELRTYKDGDGAPVGKYDVRLMMDPMSPGNVPSVKPATIEITKEGATALEIKLEATSPGAMMSPLPPPGAGGIGGPGIPKTN